MNNIKIRIFEDIANIFVEYITLIKSESKKLNFYEFKDFLAKNSDFNKRVEEYLSQIDIKPLKTVLKFQISPLKLYFDEKSVVDYENKIDSANSIEDIADILIFLFHSFYYHMDKINNTFLQLWDLIGELNRKMTSSQKQAITLIDDNIDFMKKENLSNSGIIENISSISDVISMEVNIADLKNKILNNIENTLNSIKENINSKEKKIKNYEKVYESLKLDLAIYEKQTRVMQYEINKAKKEAITDELTGFYTKKMFEIRLEEEYEFLRRNNENFSLVFLHINELVDLKGNEKEYVYKYILVHISKVIRHCIRKIDMVFKYDNDDFLVLFPKTNKDNALIVANRICETIKTTVFTYKEESIKVSVNIGGLEITKDYNKEQILDEVSKVLDESISKGEFNILIK